MDNYVKMIDDFQNLLKEFEKFGGQVCVEDKKGWFRTKTIWNFKYKNQCVGPWDGQTVVDPSGIRIISKWIREVMVE